MLERAIFDESDQFMSDFVRGGGKTTITSYTGQKGI